MDELTEEQLTLYLSSYIDMGESHVRDIVRDLANYFDIYYKGVMRKK